MAIFVDKNGLSKRNLEVERVDAWKEPFHTLVRIHVTSMTSQSLHGQMHFINKMEAEYTESTAGKSAVYARLTIRLQHGNSTSKSGRKDPIIDNSFEDTSPYSLSADFNLCFAGTHLKTQDDVRHSQAKRITSFLTNSRFDARNRRSDCDAAVL